MTAAIKLRPNRNPIIAIASGKGGVGKTWLAATLAGACGATGRRTLLIDGDLGLANVDVQLGLNPTDDLTAIITGETSILEAAIPVMGGPGKSGFDVVAGRSGSGALAHLNSDAITNLCSGIVSISLGYDLTLIDLAAGVERATLRLATLADRCLVVVTDEPTSLTDAYAFIKMVRRTKPGLEPEIVVNMAASKRSAERTYEALTKACETFLRYTPNFAGFVHRDKHVPAAIRKQTPLLKHAGQCPALTDIQVMAQRLCEYA